MTRIDPARIQTGRDLTEQLAELFHRGGWSTHRLAQASNLSTATIHAMINGGTTLPRAATVQAFVTACGQPPRPWLDARARAARVAHAAAPEEDNQEQLSALRLRAEQAEAALAAAGQAPDQLIRAAALAHLERLTERDPSGQDRQNGHLYLLAYPVTGHQDALAGLFGGDPVRELEDAVRQVTRQRGGPPFDPDLTSGRWEACGEGYVAISGLYDDRVREDSLLMLFVHDDGGGIAVVCGRGVTSARSSWRPLGSADQPPLRRVVIPSLVLGLTQGVLALAGHLAERHTGYRGTWHAGLRMEGLHNALAYDHVQQGDDDTLRPYGQDVYERTVHATADQLLTQPADVAERLTRPLLRGLRIDRRYFPTAASDSVPS